MSLHPKKPSAAQRRPAGLVAAAFVRLACGCLSAGHEDLPA